ncbi:MAG: FAD-dependent oxidoreductase [Victivallales bacterium]|nr:FAD-dependent oxidoreductase [Victivallales bacterium]
MERDIPVISDVDILVVGGGPAGLAAAISAARQGRSVALAEREFCLGGTATGSLVGPFMTCSDPDGKQQIIRGFFEELVRRLVAAGGAEDPMSITKCDGHSSWHVKGHNNVTPFHSEILKVVAEEMCEEAGVQLLYGLQAMDVQKSADGARLTGVFFLAKEGPVFVRAKAFVDCTGDGDVAFFAGCPMMQGATDTGEMQAAGFFFEVEGIDEEVFQKRFEKGGTDAMRYSDIIQRAADNGDYPIPRRRMGLYKSCDGTWRANITRIPDVDGTKSADLTRIVVEGRKQMTAYMKFLHKYVPGAEQTRLVRSASMPGVRETRRILGSFVMNEQSIINGEMFPDRILILSNSRDTHAGLIGCYIPQDRNYSLPYRILVPQGVDNLLAAGRNVSCDRPTLAAIRVMPPCFGMGEAAGVAVSLAIETGAACASIDVAELQKRLQAQGAYLG